MSTDVIPESELFDPQNAILFKPSFDPQAGIFIVLPHVLTTPRWDHTATLLPDARILITGGQNDSGYLGSAELFDPTTESFAPLAGAMVQQRAGHTATLLPDGQILILGGRNDSGYLPTAEIFNPTTE